MRNFEIFRYIRKYSALIFLFALVGAAGILWYGNKNQSYTAKVLIEYQDANAAKGLTPDGRPLDVTEIYSSKVVANAIEDLKLTSSIDYFRQGFAVKEVIPDEQKVINTALAEDGIESKYFATRYQVSFSAGGKKSEDYVRNVLDAVIKNYCLFFGEKYVEQSVLPNGIADMSVRNYDYLSCASILEKSTNEMLDYLLQKRNDYPDYRSSTTGYSYGDLVDIYTYIRDYSVPNLYSMIMADSSQTDVELLLSNLKGQYNRYEQDIASYETQLEKLMALIENLVGKNVKMQSDQLAASGSSNGGGLGVSAANISSDYILNDVESNMGAKVLTQYESLLEEYVNIQVKKETARIDQSHTAYLIGVYENMASGDVGSGADIAAEIETFVDNLNHYYEIVSQTSTELNAYRSARYLKTLSSISTSRRINITMYLVLAVAFFLVVGVVCAIVLGRVSDFIEYFKFIDEMTGLPNRQRCDDVIAEYSEILLEENFACAVICLKNLSLISEQGGRMAGDGYLKDFAAILKRFSELYGFIGYNGGGQFFAFFEKCSPRKLGAILEALENAVADYNEHHEQSFIDYTIGTAISSEAHTYEIRDLLRIALLEARESKEGNVDSETNDNSENKED